MNEIRLDSGKFSGIRGSWEYLVPTKLGRFIIRVPEYERDWRKLGAGVNEMLSELKELHSEVDEKTWFLPVKYINEEIAGLVDLCLRGLSIIVTLKRFSLQEHSFEEVVTEITKLKTQEIIPSLFSGL